MLLPDLRPVEVFLASAMSSSSFRELLEDDGSFKDVWTGLGDGFCASLQARGLKNPLSWAGLAGRATGDDLRDRLEIHLCRLTPLLSTTQWN